MARKAKAAAAEAANGGGTPGIGHNGHKQLTDDEYGVLLSQHTEIYKAKVAAKKTADANLKNCCKSAMADLGPHGVKDIKTAILLETDEGADELRAKIKREMRVAILMNSPIGTQGALFDDEDRTPASDRAYAAGKIVGWKGMPAKPPHAPETYQYRRWMDGHAEGNVALARSGFKPFPQSDEERDLRPRFATQPEA